MNVQSSGTGILKRVFSFAVILFLIIFNSSIAEASVNETFIRPKMMVLVPTSSLLRDYYDRDCVIQYGVELLGRGKDNKLGFSVQFLYYRFGVDDPNDEVTISGIWATFGIEKKLKSISRHLFGRLGVTYHIDELDDGFGSEWIRFGLQPALCYEFPFTRVFRLFVEVGYELEILKVDDYVNVDYTRHQAYLAGRRLQTGGVFFNIGMGFGLNKKRNGI